MKQFIILLAAAFISLVAVCQEKVDEKDLLDLKNRMEGSFTNELQAKTDTSYFDEHLHLVQLWPRSEDGYWLYVEQAMPALQNPYHQRIYHLYKQDDITLVSKVFEMNEPLRFAGAYANLELLKKIKKDSLIDRQGCAVYFHKHKDGNFFGGTLGKNCLNNFSSAAYSTSEVILYEHKLVSWDRGWDKENKQVWGAEKGGYQFIKQKED